ncbi:MAG: hypothetical protein K2L80_00160 [Muribaculaceae bacterium]|nr:hypothetical protein [Muribaculaceae bacterium]
MKKIYFLFSALMAFASAQAQTYVFTYNDKPVSGENLVCGSADAEIEEFDGLYDVVLKPAISISATNLPSDLEGAFDALLTVESLNGQKVQCCAGGDCTSGTDIEKELLFEVGSKQTIPVELEYLGYEVTLEEVKNIKVKLTVVDGYDQNISTSLTVVMYGEDAGVNVIENNRCFQTACGGFSYDFPGEAVVTLYNAGGAVCGSYRLSGSGFLSTEGMPAGIYFFTAVGNGVNESGKVAI